MVASSSISGCSSAVVGFQRNLRSSALARRELAAGTKDVVNSRHGRMVAQASATVALEGCVKTTMLSSVHAVRAGIMQVSSDIRQLQAIQEKKIALATEQQALLNNGASVDAALSKQFNALTNRQYEIALNSEMGNIRTMANPEANDKNLQIQLALDGAQTNFSLPTCSVDILYANTAAVRKALTQASLVPEVVSKMELKIKEVVDLHPETTDQGKVISGVNAVQDYLANDDNFGDRIFDSVEDYIGSISLTAAPATLHDIDAAGNVDAIRDFLTRNTVNDRLSVYEKQIWRDVLLLTQDINDLGTLRDAVLDYIKPRFGAVNLLNMAIKQKDADNDGVIEEGDITGVNYGNDATYAALTEVVQAIHSLNTQFIDPDSDIGAIAQDSPIWTPGGEEGNSGGAFDAQSVAFTVINQVLGRNLPTIDGVGALRDAEGEDVHNVCTIDTQARLRVAIQAEKEIAVQLAARGAVVNNVLASLSKIMDSYNTGIISADELKHVLLDVNPLQLQEAIMQDTQAMLIMASVVGAMNRDKDQEMKYLLPPN